MFQSSFRIKKVSVSTFKQSLSDIQRQKDRKTEKKLIEK
jgi:hypothetical protein